MNAPASQQPLLFMTGLSGAGMSSSLKVLEDLGYEVFDNFPLSLLDSLLAEGDHIKPIAIGIDTRTRAFDPQAIIDKAQNHNARVVFITCDENVLQQRYTETRRRHPLSGDRPASAGIKKELSLLYPLREIADPIIDTTDLSIHDLKRVLTGYFEEKRGQRLTVTFMSFGFKNGLPREADIVMDVRFLKNPHWDATLKPRTGLDKSVQDYVEKDASFAGFVENFKTLVKPLFDRYHEEGKTYLTIAFGCTGGKHRSVVMAEKLKDWAQQSGVNAAAEHRDIDRG
ncbi:MAG: RNase adapter RapZ [Micavibrio aeruginosavorus]|uniref:RNase adapter RapZ n=1 Tax=Micavibrio aeruginosavorus TaxID=349221 RepID=A0A2W5N7V8_9BACT|nr:MAG: RNase adapter RapZ [Micavibrio aeruginosavorus]